MIVAVSPLRRRRWRAIQALDPRVDDMESSQAAQGSAILSGRVDGVSSDLGALGLAVTALTDGLNALGLDVDGLSTSLLGVQSDNTTQQNRLDTHQDVLTDHEQRLNVIGALASTFGDTSASNELNTSLALSELHVDLSPLMNDADADPSNELQSLSVSGSTLSLSGGGEDVTVDPSATNDVQSVSRSGVVMTLSGGGGSFSVDDADASATNETNTAFTVTGSILRITDVGGAIQADLSALLSGADTSTTNEHQTVSRTAPSSPSPTAAVEADGLGPEGGTGGSERPERRAEGPRERRWKPEDSDPWAEPGERQRGTLRRSVWS